MQPPPETALIELLGRIAPDRQARRPVEIGPIDSHVVENMVLIACQPPDRPLGQPMVPQPGQIPAIWLLGQRLDTRFDEIVHGNSPFPFRSPAGSAMRGAPPPGG